MAESDSLTKEERQGEEETATTRDSTQENPDHNPLHEYSVSLPQCTYTQAFLAVHEFKDCLTAADPVSFEDFWFQMFGSVIPGVALFLMSIAAQIVFTYFVLQELEDVDVCDISTSVWIQWSGVALFIGSMLKESVETIHIAYWMLGSDHVAKDFTGDFPEPLTALDKIAGIVLLVIPKFAIGLWLTWVGSRFVLLSITNTDLVMNCLAMTFVVDIDELVHEAASNQYAKKAAELVKPFVSHRPNAFFMDQIATTPLKLLVWGGAVLYFKMTTPQC